MSEGLWLVRWRIAESGVSGRWRSCKAHSGEKRVGLWDYQGALHVSQLKMHFPFCKQRDFRRENQPAKVLGWPAVRLRLAWGRLQHWGSHCPRQSSPQAGKSSVTLMETGISRGLDQTAHVRLTPSLSNHPFCAERKWPWVTAGTEAHGCVGGDMTRGSGRNPLYLVSRCCTHWRCQLSQCC